jgi:hypothetical protein
MTFGPTSIGLPHMTKVSLASLPRRIVKTAPPDATLHLVIARHRGGAFAAERDLRDLGLESTIADIIRGEIDDVAHVIALNPVECWSRDVTEDVAIEIANRVGAGPIRPSLRDFIEDHAGLDYARELAVVERAFSAG